MNTTLNEWLAEDPERERLFAQERLIVAVAERIWEQMEARKISKADIAAALGKSKAFVTQLLDGSRNMTLRSLADVAYALGVDVDVQFQHKQRAREWRSGTTVRFYTAVVSERRAQIDPASLEEIGQKESLVRQRLAEAA